MSFFHSTFAETIYSNKYAHETPLGKESWPDTCRRVVESVVKPYLPHLVPRLTKFVREKKFVPGGRYFASAGRKYHQTNNCFLFSVQDTKEDWGRLMNDITVSLMTGGGVGVVYSKLRGEGEPVDGMGGESTGPCALINMVNEAGRHIKQGGSRRSAIWAGLHWSHPDIFQFICMKNWSPLIHRCRTEDFNFPAPMDGTNISVILDTRFFDAYHNPSHEDHYLARRVYQATIEGALRTGEPGFSVDIGGNDGENLRNAPVHGDTRVLTSTGYQRVADLVGTPSTVWTGKQWASEVLFQKTGSMVPTIRVVMTGGREIVCEPSHPFLVESYSGAGVRRKLSSIDRVEAKDLEEGDVISVSLPQPDITDGVSEAYLLGYLYGDGSFVSKGCAEVAICSASKEVCLNRLTNTLSHTMRTDSRGYKRIYYHSNTLLRGRDKETCPDSPSANWTASFIAGLFDADGNALPSQMRFRLSSVRLGFLQGVQRLLDSIGILSHISKGGPSGYGGRRSWQLVVASDYVQRFSEVVPTERVKLDTTNYKSFRKSTVKVISVEPAPDADVYCADVGVEEHSFCAEGVLVSNCTEVCSRDNRDMCNLFSINMANVESEAEFGELVDLGMAFGLCGTLYSKLPIPEMHKVREKNRRLGLGLMGVHEWLLKRGYRYEPCQELQNWMEQYACSDTYAKQWSDILGVSIPVATRSIAPTGTISIIAETTSGIEPIFAVAYKRRYLDGKQWKAQYVVDATAKRLIDNGVDPDLIEDACLLSEDVSRRIRFQSFMQKYVDHGISSTINLPEWGSPLNNEDGISRFADTLMSYLPTLRGITVYPNGSRGGQPLTRVPYKDAIGRIGQEFVEVRETGDISCVGGFCNS